MPPIPCFHVVGIPQSVIQRGYHRESCFSPEPDDHWFLKSGSSSEPHQAAYRDLLRNVIDNAILQSHRCCR